MGVRQGDGEEVEEYVQSFVLYSSPPGTWQRMAVHFCAGAGTAPSSSRFGCEQ